MPGIDRSSTEAYAVLREEHNRLTAKHRELADAVRDAVEAVDAGDVKPLVALRRLRKSVQFGGRSWTADEVLVAAWEWAHRFGTSPTASDWNPALLRKKDGDPVALDRYVSGEWPSTATVMRRFGTWATMLEAAELPTNDEKVGRGAVRTTGDLIGLPEWTGWELVGGFRERSHSSFADLARQSGLSWATVRNIEQGKAPNPTLRVFLALAVGLGVKPGALLEYRTPEALPTHDR